MNSGSLLPVVAGIGNNNNNCCMASNFTNPFIHNGQGLEEMRHLLMCATLELDSARAVASAEVELHDEQVRHLQELLAAAQRERDEAREQYLGLQGCLSRSPSINGRGSVGRSESQLPNSGLSGVSLPASTVQDHVQQQQQQLDMEELQKHLEILEDENLEILQDEHLDHLEDLADLDSVLQIPEQTEPNSLQSHITQQYFHQPGIHDSGSDVELLSHIRQEQALQSDRQVILMEQRQQAALHLPEPHSTTPMAAATDNMTVLQQSPWRQSPSLSGSSPGFSPPPPVLCTAPPLLNPSLPPPALFQTAGSAVNSSSLLGSLERPYECTSGSTGLSIQRGPAASLQPVPKHVLPEPPEADLQVMLSSLPEKGKLMQAVMDAGPLLQTLLMASSPAQLPQWRHPPPGLDQTLDGLPCMTSFSSPTSCKDPNKTGSTVGSNNNNNNMSGPMATMPQPKYHGVHTQLQRLSSFSSHGSIIGNNSSSSSPSAVSGLSHVQQRNLRRVNSMPGHLIMSPEMALTNPPRKYTKIY